MGAIFPLWIVVIGLFTAKRKMPAKAIIGMLLGFGGVCIIFYEHLDDFLNPDFLLGILLSLIATWAWAFGLYIQKNMLPISILISAGLQMVIRRCIVIISLLPAMLFLYCIPWQSWAAIGYLIIFGSVIAFIRICMPCNIFPLSRFLFMLISILLWPYCVAGYFFGKADPVYCCWRGSYIARSLSCK